MATRAIRWPSSIIIFTSRSVSVMTATRVTSLPGPGRRRDRHERETRGPGPGRSRRSRAGRPRWRRPPRPPWPCPSGCRRRSPRRRRPRGRAGPRARPSTLASVGSGCTSPNVATFAPAASRRSTSGPAGPLSSRKRSETTSGRSMPMRATCSARSSDVRRRSAGPGAGAARWWRRPPWRLLSGRIRDPSTLTGPAVACRPCPPRKHRSMVSTARRCAAGRTRPSSRGRAPTPTTSTRPARSTRTSCAPRSRTARIVRDRHRGRGGGRARRGRRLHRRRPRPRALPAAGRWRPTTCCARRWRATSCASRARRSRSSWPRAAAAAVDAAELVDVDIEPLDVVVDPERALDDDAPQLFADKGSNLAFAGRHRRTRARSRAPTWCVAQPLRQPAPRRRADGAVGRRRRARPGDRRRAHLGAAAGAAHRARRLRRRARPGEGRRPRDGAQRRRRLRRAHRRLSRAGRGGRGGAARWASRCATSRAAGRR